MGGGGGWGFFFLIAFLCFSFLFYVFFLPPVTSIYVHGNEHYVDHEDYDGAMATFSIYESGRQVTACGHTTSALLNLVFFSPGL